MTADRWTDGDKGTVSFELAIIFPVVLLLVLGGYETYLWVRTIGVLERTVFSVANIISQRSFLCDSMDTSSADYIGSYFSAAQQIAQPLDYAHYGKMIVSGVVDNNDGKGPVVAWQVASGDATFPMGSTIGNQGGAAILPGGIAVTADGIDTAIVTEIAYEYSPYPITRGALWSMAPGDQIFRRQAYFRARLGHLGKLDNSDTNPVCP